MHDRPLATEKLAHVTSSHKVISGCGGGGVGGGGGDVGGDISGGDWCGEPVVEVMLVEVQVVVMVVGSVSGGGEGEVLVNLGVYAVKLLWAICWWVLVWFMLFFKSTVGWFSKAATNREERGV